MGLRCGVPVCRGGGMMLVDAPRTSAARPVRPSRYWMIANHRFSEIEVMTEDLEGRGEALVVFRFEEEAGMFLWLRRLEDVWEVRETTAGELVSVLYGPCAHVRCVILDPLPEIWAGATVELESLARKDFVKTVMGARSFGAAPKISGIVERTSVRKPALGRLCLPFWAENRNCLLLRSGNGW